MRYFLLHVASIIFLAGRSQNISPEIKHYYNQSHEDYNVILIIKEQIPYCGGASPSEEMLNQTAPYSDSVVVINLETDEKMVIAPNQNGKFYLQVTEGKYAIKENYKNVSFADFMSMQESGDLNYSLGDADKCYKQWWESVLTRFEISSSQGLIELNCIVSNRCFTGKNPCEVYNGPWPP